jgi:hypothetical protein
LKPAKLYRIIFAGSIVLVFGWLLFKALNEQECRMLSQSECGVLWGTAIASIAGGVLFVEMLLARSKGVNAEQGTTARGLQQEEKPISTSWVWKASILRVILITLLTSLPIILKGAFVIAMLGAILGAFLDGLIRAIIGRLPSLEDNNRS